VSPYIKVKNFVYLSYNLLYNIFRGGVAMGPFNFVYNIGLLQAILLFAGFIFIFIEMFNPGFGIPGITGIILLIIGVIVTANSLLQALVMALIIIIILGVALYFVMRSASRGKLNKKLVLPDSMKKDQGFSSVESYDQYIGKEGIALTILRPSGSAEFDGIILDVVTEGKFIPKDSKVKVIEVTGRRIVVREVE
jgi:membrane-bound ClpP family serine protease